MEVEQTPMSDKVKDRIQKDAEVHAASEHYQMQARISYYTGATSERPKAWNDALDAAIYDFDMVGGSWSASQIIERLEKLKHKQP